MAKSVSYRERRRAAGELVERSRAGDQVAMAIITLVGQGAKKGDPKFKDSFKLLGDYIKKNPVGSMHGEDIAIKVPVPFWQKVVSLANGPSLILATAPNNKPTTLALIDNVIAPVHKNSFRFGLNNWRSQKPEDADREAWGFGRIVGIARAIQLVRRPDVPLSVLCPIVAWELE